MKASKRHHFVPQHLIRQFRKENGQVHVFDKKTMKQFTQVPKNVFAENKFHEFKTEKYIVSFEKGITAIENSYLPALKKLWHYKKLDSLNQHELDQLLLFIAFQFLRTSDLRQRFLEMQKDVYNKVQGIAQGRKISPDIMPMHDDNIKKFSLRFFK